MSERLGVSGAIAKKFLHSEITPLLALVGLLMGVFALAITPREEEPQINVTFANVFIPFPGAQPSEVEHLVARPAEQVLSEIEGIKHVYSLSQPGIAVLTVRYKVGEDPTRAIVRLYNKVFSNQDWLPANLGVGQPLIKPKEIDDVPIVTLTLWSETPATGAFELQQVAHAMEAELKRVSGTRDIYTVGGPDRVVHVLLDPQRLAGFGLALNEIQTALTAANTSIEARNVTRENREILVQAGTFFSNPDEVGDLVVGLHDGNPVYLWEVADIRKGPDQPEQYVWFGTGAAAEEKGITAAGTFPAVTLAVAKKPGTNAVTVADKVIERVDQIRGIFIPEGVNVTVTRNYGATADEKAQTLIHKLIFATTIVVALVLVTLGWREALIVGTAVIITLAITLFASWAWGFTLNRVSLFALIFSIGILVDDAIVVVENIHRHMQMGGKTLSEAIPVAVDEVGGPTILATFTVVAALLPMAFVTGLMGPYMSPIPINASMGMVISLAVAFVITPWLTFQVLKKSAHEGEEPVKETHQQTWLHRLFARLIGPFLTGTQANRNRWLLLATMLFLIAAAVSLAVFKLVILKMLPFDNKSEVQVVVDMPEGTSLEQTARVLSELGDYVATVPEVTDYQAYVGTASPINFNGLVRQYYLREGANVGDLQVNLVDKAHRERKSHEIALALRPRLDAIGRKFDANVKVVEVPPGPPVQAPLVAEIYGLDYQGQIEVAKKVRQVFEATGNIVDVDDSVEAAGPKWVIHVDRQKAALLGIDQRTVTDAVGSALKGSDVAYLRAAQVKYPIPIRLEFSVADKADVDAFLSLQVPSREGNLVPLSEVVRVERTTRAHSVNHKDLLPVVYVTGDLAGGTDSPLYGMFQIYSELGDMPLTPVQDMIRQYFIQPPGNPYQYSLKWDGEWQVTYETFRDMGIAYGVGLILIYLLIVAQFRSYLVPLIIMVAVPLTIIGVMPGHALLGEAFTATSMIGMIALAGIIVRNSILLVDFINEEWVSGVPLHEAVIRAGAVRAKPIALTALAAILGAFFIIDDPIFSGLAISLIFGILVSTVLTLVIIPVMYFAFMKNKVEQLR